MVEKISNDLSKMKDLAVSQFGGMGSKDFHELYAKNIFKHFEQSNAPSENDFHARYGQKLFSGDAGKLNSEIGGTKSFHSTYGQKLFNTEAGSLNKELKDLHSQYRTNGYSAIIGKRRYNAMMAQMNTNYHRYESSDILASDMKTLEPLAEALHEYRYWFTGKKIGDTDRVLNILDYQDEDGAHKNLSLYKVYCAKYGGLKDKNGPINFDNLKDPTLLIRQSKDFWGLNASSKHNNVLDKLADIAVDAYSPELAAALLKESGDLAGVNDKLVKNILVDSKKRMDENTYNRFISETDSAYRENTGKSLDKFIKEEYSKEWFGTGWFGANKQGKEYLKILDSARKNTSGMNPNMFSLGAGMSRAF